MKISKILGIFIGLFIGLVTVLGMSLFIFINLKFNSVYYAQHIPHKKGTEPDLVMLIENMDWIYTPEIDGIRYDNDGTNAIINTKSKSFLTKSLGSFLYDKDNMTVGFDSTFRFEDVSYFSEEAKRIQVNESKIKREIREDFSPIMKVQTKPLINLQWLFNLIYQSRFN
ncbi:hypothetical protein ACVRV9_00080 [Streptococcus vestibularis]|jgi:hypothetical protein|uniref:hypothetical protein n=1 Tax=Streptococcus vestibularis TaxID=1343 RepID=UPI000F6F9746|nr:hypothetical protein [Streptococcus vestibularis]MCY7010075.1 hypothetical protein [Streptococcus vestibularis]MDB6184068.1 hypothetical protein [Streptococcus vestibularis]MDB6201644.1 hypothetical protein [Streptococcus vestibularis]MDB6207164.1 hypothetical protein [Streptococcus vestibularis]MDB6211294.1 hypothetical protein [Streptococcus vestibularis]